VREKEPHTTLILVRHGEPDYPEDRIYAREDDPGLTDNGFAQADALANWFQGEAIDALYVSPTRRTVETAAPVAKVLGLDPVVEGRLQERHFGVWEGMYFDAIRDRYPEGFRSWKADPIGFSPDGGETIVDMEKRVGAALEDIRGRHPGRAAVLVTHVGTIRTALCEALKTPLAEYRRFNIPTGSLVRIDYGRHQANLMYLGVTPGGRTGWTGGDA